MRTGSLLLSARVKGTTVMRSRVSGIEPTACRLQEGLSLPGAPAAVGGVSPSWLHIGWS